MHYLFRQTKKFIVLITIFLLTGLFCPISGYAHFPWPSDTFETEKTKPYQLQVNTHAMTFLNEDQLRYFAGTELAIQNMINIHASYTYSIYEDYHYFRLYEMNLHFERPGGQWVIGRRRIQWDWADAFWNRSLWEPVYADDALRPQWAGLTGVFRDFSYQEGQTTLFGSFIFIPDFTAPFKNQDGRLVSDNPWFNAPPAKKMENIVPSYNITTPDLKDFLLLSIGGQTSYKGMYIAYAYKPMNKINKTSFFSLDLSKEPESNDTEGFKVNIPVNTMILHHHLLSGGFTLNSSQRNDNKKTADDIHYRLKGSFTYNHPETYTKEKKEELFDFKQTRNEWHLSIKGEVHIKDHLEETTLHAAYTHQLHTGEEKKNTTLSEAFPDIENLLFPGDLFDFSRATSVGINHSIKFNNMSKARIKARFIYHLLNNYFLFSFHGSLTFAESFSVFLSGDLLFPEFPFSFSQIQENLGAHKNNSRLFGGLSYVF